MNKKQLIKAALEVAKLYPVFPTKDKTPVWSNKELGVAQGMGGYKIASQDPTVVKNLFSHSRATEIAVPMGAMSGLLCIDVDIYKNIDGLSAWWDTHAPVLNGTLQHQTRSGGLHYIFEHPGEDYKLPSKLREGVDLKAQGNGYICFPPTEGYTEVYPSSGVVQKITVLDIMEMYEGPALGDEGRSGDWASYNSETDEDLLGSIRTATDLYPALRTLSMRLINQRDEQGLRLDAETVQETLERIMDSSEAANEGHPRHEDWLDRVRKIPDLVKSGMAKADRVALDDDMISALANAPPVGNEAAFPRVREVGVQKETTKADIEAILSEDDDDDGEYVVFTPQSLRQMRIPPIKWLIEDLIPEGNIVSLAGTSNVGKTRWLASLAVCMAAGMTEKIGLPKCTGRINVIWHANEEKVDDIGRRLKAAGRHYLGDADGGKIVVRGKDSGMWRLVGMNEVRNPEIDQGAVAKVCRYIIKHDIKLLILDPYVTLSEAMDENSAVSASMLTKAFLLIHQITGVAVLHAHHTPKAAGADPDWYRADSGAWRGSGAIHSGLDVGITISPWLPNGKGEERKAWKNATLDHALHRWIVVDVAKVREGEALRPIVYHLEGVELDEGEGRPIGICRLSSAEEAANALIDESVNLTRAELMAESAVTFLGPGRHDNMREVSAALKGKPGWWNADRFTAKQMDELMKLLGQGVHAMGHAVSIDRMTMKPTKRSQRERQAYRLLITEA